MYDRAENADAHDRLWNAIHAEAMTRGVALPEHLTRGVSEDALWSAPDLILGQICNLPFRQTYYDRLHVIGAMDYGVDHLDAGFYDSVIITRPEHIDADVSKLRFAYNATESNSGWDAAHLWAEKNTTQLNPTLETGGHRASLKAVAQGQADIAALDCITFRQCLKWDAEAHAVVVKDRTAATPGMLLVTTKPDLKTALFDIFNTVLSRIDPTEPNALGLTKIVPIDAQTVQNLPKSRLTT